MAVLTLALIVAATVQMMIFQASAVAAGKSTSSYRLTVAGKRDLDAAAGDGTAGGAEAGREVATDKETTGLAAGSGGALELTVLVDGVNNPVDAGVLADGSVAGVNHDNLEELVGGILSSPVRVEHAEVGAAASSTALSDSAERASSLASPNTVVGGLAVDNTLGVLALGGAAADTDAVHDVALLGLVAKAASLVGARGTRATVDGVELAELPDANTEDEAHHFGLLLLPELFQILVSTCCVRKKSFIIDREEVRLASKLEGRE